MKKFFYLLVNLVYFLTPFESVAILPGISVVKLFTAIFLISSFFYFRKYYLPKSTFIQLFLIYVFYCTLSSIWSINITTTLYSSVGIILPSLLLIYFLYNAIQNKNHIQNIFKSYALGSLIVALITIYMWATGFRFADNIEDARATVLGQDQNELSFLLSFGIISFLYLINFTTLATTYKMSSYLAAAIISFAILTTGSRTGFIILLIISIILFFMNIKKGRIIYLIPFVLAFGILLLRYLPETTINRLFQTTDQLKNRDLTGRGYIWSMGWKAFENSNAYILGTGFKTFPELLQRNFGWSAAPHNTYLVTLIELGIVGLILYAAMLYNLGCKVYSLVKRNSLFYSLLILPLLVTMLTLGLETRRWLFLIGVLILKISEFEKIEDRYIRFKKLKPEQNNFTL